MYSLHITDEALIDICIGKYPNWNFIAQKQNIIKVDSPNESSIYLDEENVVNIFCRMYDVEFKSEKSTFDMILANPSKVLDTPCGAYILNVDHERARKIEIDYGVVSQSVDSINDECVNFSKSSNCSNGATIHSWSSILQDFPKHATNTIIINDRYLFKNDSINSENGIKDVIGIDNCIDIIDSILPEKYLEYYHILIFFNNDEISQGMSFAKIATELNKRIKRLREYAIVFELIGYNPNCFNYEYTHNRRIVTSCHLIIAEHKYTAFKNTNRSTVDQRINCEMLYFHSGIQNQSDLPLETHKSFIKRFRDIVEYAKKHIGSGYKYARDGNCNVEFKDFKNRLLQ